MIKNYLIIIINYSLMKMVHISKEIDESKIDNDEYVIDKKSEGFEFFQLYGMILSFDNSVEGQTDCFIYLMKNHELFNFKVTTLNIMCPLDSGWKYSKNGKIGFNVQDWIKLQTELTVSFPSGMRGYDELISCIDTIVKRILYVKNDKNLLEKGIKINFNIDVFELLLNKCCW